MGARADSLPVALRVEATLPPTTESDDTLALVKSYVLKGLSVEFEASQEKTEGYGWIAESPDRRYPATGSSSVDSPAFASGVVGNDDRPRRTSCGRGAWAHTISR